FSEHVEIPHDTQGGSDPIELASKLLGPSIENRSRGTKDGSKPTDGRSHLVKLLRIGAEACARIVGTHRFELPAKHRSNLLGRRGRSVAGLERGHHLDAERLKEQGGAIAMLGACVFQ